MDAGKYLERDFEQISDKKKYTTLSSAKYMVTNFNLASKRGGVGDSSHWSSGTEYLNEQFLRKYSKLGSSNYGLSYLGSKNSKFPLAGEFESEHTDDDFILRVSDGQKNNEAGMYGRVEMQTGEDSEFSAEIMSEIGNEIDDFYDDRFKNEQNLDLFSYID